MFFDRFPSHCRDLVGVGDVGFNRKALNVIFLVDLILDRHNVVAFDVDDYRNYTGLGVGTGVRPTDPLSSSRYDGDPAFRP